MSNFGQSSAVGDSTVRRHGSQQSVGGTFYPSHASRASYSVPQGQTSIFAAPQTKMEDMDSVVAKAKNVASKVEDIMDRYSQPVRPYLPAIGRFLIVCTFLEDALRMLTQWSDQKFYLQRHRGFPWGISHLFLLTNIITMSVCSVLVIRRKFPLYSVVGLLSVVLIQGFGYGLIFDLNFFLRNLSVVGGILMVFAETMSNQKQLFAGIPNMSEDERKHYVQAAGRVLLIFLFLGFVLNGKMTFSRALVSIIGLAACVCVAVGFKAKLSALFLVLFLSIMNLAMNNFWRLPAQHPQRDFLRYDFFQTLSIIGGLMLLANMGAGNLSFDAKKRK